MERNSPISIILIQLDDKNLKIPFLFLIFFYI